MELEHVIARYRCWYRTLLRLYSRSYREQFAESMEQTFHDLCRERSQAGKRLSGFVLWVFAETSVGIVKEKARFLIMQNLTRRLVVWAAVIALLLLFPMWANHNIEGWNWSPFDFVFAAVVLYGAALTYELIAAKGGTFAYRAAVGVACATGLVLLWINAAVGIIGDGPVNLLYLGVLAVAFIGALIARFQPRPMVRALFATALAQMSVPVIALAIWKAGGQDLLIDPHSPHPPFHPGVPQVFALNAFFAVLWIVSGVLFRHAAEPVAIAPPHLPPVDREA
jgi:hypothetical protein